LADEPASQGQDHADAVAGQVDDGRRVQRALAVLTSRDAEILRLSAWEDLRVDEIAFVLGCTSAAAKVRRHRARRRFAAALQDHSQPQIRTAREATA
jgi:RNA polymerase sigma-70 factor (ECF subfamily)